MIDWRQAAVDEEIYTDPDLLEEAIYEGRLINSRATKAQMAARRSALWMICREIAPCTVRQVFYQASVRHLIEKTERGYDQVQRCLVELRMQWGMPFDWIADNTRWMRKPRTFVSIEQAVKFTAETYRRALWTDTDCYVEVWIEKDALAGVIDPITREYDVPLMVSRGYSSITFLHGAAEAIRDQGKPAFIYHLGDWDPSGQNAADKIEETLMELAPDADIAFQKLAVTPRQIERWELPSRPTKQTDSRTAKWTGGDSVELDAIHPDELRNLVRRAIEGHISEAQLATIKVAEESERELLRAWRPRASGRKASLARRDNPDR